MGLINGKVYLEKNYDKWKRIFNEEKDTLKEIISDSVIEHVGSTAVPGLSSKPIVDIAVGVKDLLDIDLDKLSKLYTVKENKEDNEILLIKEDEKETESLIHVLNDDSDRYNNLIKFRDILLNNEDIKRQYEKLKTELADKYKDNRKEYTKSKDDFISKVLRGNLLK